MECEKVYTNSKIVSSRLVQFNQIESEVLYPPLPRSFRHLVENYSQTYQGTPYVLYISRITPIKRQVLAVKAMEFVKSDVKLVIAGAPDEDRFAQELIECAKQSTVPELIDLRLNWVDDSEKANLIKNAVALLYLPVDEDSYGYPTLEAFTYSKPMITLEDSGGVHELIVHQFNGLVSKPNPKSLAEAIDYAVLNPELASLMGAQGLLSMNNAGINWDNVLTKFLEE